MADVVSDATLSADRKYIIQHVILKGYQTFSLLTPPLYAGVLLWRGGRSGVSIAQVLRASWIGSFSGAALGGGLAFGRLSNQTAESIHDRSVRLSHNVGFHNVIKPRSDPGTRHLQMSQKRVDDYSMIGAVLSGVLTPAIFWNHARIIDLILGGLAFGSAGGIVFHLTRSFSSGESVNPEGMRDIIENTEG